MRHRRSPLTRAALALLTVVAVLSTQAIAPAGAITIPPDPTFVRTFGTSGSGVGQMDQPSAVAIGPDGTIYVADTTNSRILRYDGNTGALLGSFGAGGPAPSTLGIPYGITVDEAGDVWVPDTFNHRIKRFSATGEHELTFGEAGSGDGQLNLPFGLAVSGDHVYVADAFNHRIQEFTRAGAFVRAWGSSGTADGQFNQPGDVDVNRQGEVVVADTYNSRIQVFSPTGVFLRKWGTSGVGDGQFGAVQSVDVDGAGHVWVADKSGRIQRFGRFGAFLGAFGASGVGPADIGSPYGVEARGGQVVVASASLDKVVVFAACGPGTAFTDLPTTNPFFDAVCWGTATGLVAGYSDGTFRGTAPVTRQAAAVYLHRLFNQPLGPFPDPYFSDVLPGHPFRTQILWMANAGLTNGYSDGTFRPSAPVSRQAMAVELYQAAGAPAGPFPDPGFSDVPADHPFFNQIAWLASTGITQGYSDGTYRPTSPVSRQAMVQFLGEVDAAYFH